MKSDNVFTEKYRPASLDEVVGQEHIVNALKGFLRNGNTPHMLFSGEPGVGKTTVAIAFAKALYGTDWHRNFFELNASDEGGVEVMRTKIKDYANTIPINAQYKLLFMDEADFLTNSAQASLRRPIETASKISRFIFSCNFPHKIIEPIVDRCAQFRFKLLDANHIQQYIEQVIEKEDIQITEDATQLIAQVSKGSMRKALNLLQVLKLSDINPIKKQHIYDYVYWIDENDIKQLLSYIAQKDLNGVDKQLKLLLFDKCYTIKEVLNTIGEQLKESDFSTRFKLRAIDKLSDIEFQISMKATPLIQLRGYCAHLIRSLE